MFGLLALLAVGFLAAAGGSKKATAPPRLIPIKAAPPATPGKPRLIPITGVRLVPPTQQKQAMPTLAQLLAAQAEALLQTVDEVERVHYAQAATHVPAPDSDPSVFTAWASSYGLNGLEFMHLTPFFGWYPNRPQSILGGPPILLHPETLWRASYKFPDTSRGAVSWWVNDDGPNGSTTYNYDHVWGGFDLWKSITDLVNDVSNAANWLESHLSHVDWQAIADDIETVASVVPVLGTAVSDIVATAEVVIEDLENIPGLEKAVDTAYDYALATIPGGAALHGTLDPIKDAIVRLALQGEKVGKEVIDQLAAEAPDSPNIEGITPRSIVTSLLTIVAHALGVAT